MAPATSAERSGSATADMNATIETETPVGGSLEPACCVALVRKWKALRTMWENYHRRATDVECGRRAECRVRTYTRCIEDLEYALKQHNAAPHLPPPGRQVEHKQDIEIVPGHRAESAGGG